jgi:hypothetical protein
MTSLYLDHPRWWRRCKDKDNSKRHSHAKHEGTLTEHEGSKITMDPDGTGLGTVQFIQPILIHKCWERYGPMEGPGSQLPVVVANQVLIKGDGDMTTNDTIAKM